ncbi:MAG: TIR domain-containing protein [Magnetococcales bacterium]|nr:TIR domain-containing protein [Magnetococcales bacterium]
MQNSFAFITYRHEDVNLAKEVCDYLTEKKFSVWQVENGDPEGAFLSRMDKDIIKNINCLIILITRSICNPDWQSPWARDDTNLARREGICLLPVIGDQTLKGLWQELPKSLTNPLYIEWYVEEDRARLTSHLQPCQVSRVPIMMPAKPANFVQRDTAFTVVKKALLRTGTESDPAPLSAALLGTGGFGKTCLATAICHDSEIQDRFHDGILWVTVGKEPKGLPPDEFLLSKVQELIQILGSNTTETTTLETVVVLLEQLLDKKNVLLVVDDVWTSRDLTHFLKGGRGTVGRLITTRNGHVLDTSDIKVDVIQQVELMQENEAVQLLATASSNDPQVTEQLKRLARQCDYWPPLLVQASGWLEMADSEENIVEHRKKLAASILDPSMELLSDREYGAFRALAISFPAGPIPLADLYSLWSSDPWRLNKVDVGELLFKLLDHSLLQHLNVASAVVQLHDVVRTHLATA